MNNLRYATVMTIEELVSSSQDLKEFIEALGLKATKVTQQKEIEQPCR